MSIGAIERNDSSSHVGISIVEHNGLMKHVQFFTPLKSIEAQFLGLVVGLREAAESSYAPLLVTLQCKLLADDLFDNKTAKGARLYGYLSTIRELELRFCFVRYQPLDSELIPRSIDGIRTMLAHGDYRTIVETFLEEIRAKHLDYFISGEWPSRLTVSTQQIDHE